MSVKEQAVTTRWRKTAPRDSERIHLLNACEMVRVEFEACKDTLEKENC